MHEATPKVQAGPFQPGVLSFGRGVEKSTPARVFAIVFKCRKTGFNYMGQMRLKKDKPEFQVELFNEHYFSHFAMGKNEVLDLLKSNLLRRLMADVKLPSGYILMIRMFLQEKSRPVYSGPGDAIGPLNASKLDLKEIYDRLNEEYFQGAIRADVGWGRDSKTPNRNSIRFGSYDIRKKVIRIHPRLNQDFVPRHVVELTVYHEMCHQWAPSCRKNGMWRDHHSDFKKKEREYRFYREARLWEKQNWKKLLKPVGKGNS